MMYSKSLHVTEVSETGLQFSAVCLSPFLNTGVTLAFVQSSGKHPELSDVLNIQAWCQFSCTFFKKNKYNYGWVSGQVLELLSC